MNSPDYLLRPEDNAFRTLFPTMEDSTQDMFNEFFDADNDLYNLDNDDGNKEHPTLDEFLATAKAESPTPIKLTRGFAEASPQPWRKGLWCLNSKQPSELVVGKTRKSGPTTQNFVSPTHLLNNDSFSLRNPISPSRMSTKDLGFRPSAASEANRKNFSQNKFTLQQLPVPASEHSQPPSNKKMSYGEKWQQDFQNFHLQMPDNGIYLSPRQTTRQDQHEAALRQANARLMARNATISHTSQSPKKYHYPFQHASQENSYYAEVAVADVLSHEPSHELLSNEFKQLERATYGLADTDACSAPVWTTESLRSSDSSNHSQGSQYSNESFQNNFLATTADNWLSSVPTASFSLPSDDFFAKIAAPTPQRPAAQIFQRQREEYHSGIGIHEGTLDGIGMALSYEAPQDYSKQYHAIATPPPTMHTPANYPPLPPYPAYTVSNVSAFTIPHDRASSESRTPSSSVSPTHRSMSRGYGQRSPTRTDNSRSRSKSIHKPGPIKDTSRDENRRRARSTSRPPRTPKTPKTPKTPMSASFAQIDFVNFTCKDSAKLMADVAPSGSSKTRQRREQEAKDKRKKLNEVALQAVQRAGGDVTALKKAIFV